jgi:signal transduction histidine kinase
VSSSEEGALPAEAPDRPDVERNLQEHVARLEESRRFYRLFCDVVSHDLMSPVWIAENYLKLVMDGGIPDEKRVFYEGLRGALAKARGILADTRTFLRVQDLVALNGESVDLGLLAADVAQGLRPLAAQKGVQLALACAAGASITADQLMIREVAGQLVTNAVKHSPAGAQVVIAVSDGPRVRLEIRDDGPGVPEADREGIFGRFDRMEKGPISGSGLGLAIVRRVVELHRGRVWVEDNPGGGAAFVVEFPAAD